MRFYLGDILLCPDDIANGCDLVFTDPPWEERMAKWFGTASRKAGGPSQSGSIDEILEKMFSLSPSDVPVFVEYGIKGYERVINIGKSQGYEFVTAFKAIQTTKYPYMIIQFNSDMPSIDRPSGFDVLRSALKYHKPQKVFEPFAGLGKHAEIIRQSGADVVCCELNPARGQKAKERLKEYEF